MAIDDAGLPPQRQHELILSEEQLQVGTEWLQAKRLTATVRVVTEVKTYEVEVRRQELVVTETDLPHEPAAAEARPGNTKPIVIVLSEEIPVITLEPRAYERVTFTVETVTREHEITADLSYEELDDSPATS